VIAFDDAEQSEEVGKRVFKSAIEHHNLPRDLLAPSALFVLGRDLEIAFEQVDHGQISRRLAVQHRIRFQDQAAALCDRFKLEYQTRFPYARLAHCGDDLTMALTGEFKRMLHLIQLGLAAHKLRKSPLRGYLQSRPKRA